VEQHEKQINELTGKAPTGKVPADGKFFLGVRMRVLVMAVAGLMAAGAVTAGKPAKNFVVVNEEVGVPVFPNDITDRPYEVVGEVKAEVRKATIFSSEASQAKIYRELWERAEKKGADAVVNARYGDSRVTLMSWGSTAVTGTAIKFKPADAPAAPAAAADAAPAASAAAPTSPQ
jgi:uncharacterized protein YbjQ (UPF0145 family)